MQLKKLTRNDAKSMNKWLKLRHSPAIQYLDMPEMSYMVPGVAAFGIRWCEGNVGILDSIVTNPHVSGPTRDKALNAIFEYVTNLKSFKGIIGFTIHENTLKRAVKHGFQLLPYSTLSFSKDS